MANSNVSVTAGSGTTIDTYQLAGGDHQQIIREARASVATPSAWSPPATGTASIIAADETRLGLMIVNNCNQRVYLNFSTTIPTTTVFSWFLDTGDRWEVPQAFVQLPLSGIPAAAVGSGDVRITEGEAA